jgi:hypothetical protein
MVDLTVDEIHQLELIVARFDRKIDKDAFKKMTRPEGILVIRNLAQVDPGEAELILNFELGLVTGDAIIED